MSKFWDEFDNMFKSMGKMFDKLGEEIHNDTTINMSSRKVTSVHIPKMSFSSSTSEITQNGKKIVIKTVNNKTTIKVNGKEYVEKK